MSEAAVRFAVARLLSAYANPEPPEETAELYAERLTTRCPNIACLTATVDELIDAGTAWLPRIGTIIELYRRNLPRYAPLALPMPDVSVEQRAENTRRMRALTDHLVARGEDGHSIDLEGCEHPECREGQRD